MLRYHSYNIVFQEVPNEVALAINIANCPNGCKGCHSAYLQEDNGNTLDESVINSLLAKYGDAITCICFMGGDANPQAVDQLSHYIHYHTGFQIKTAWYSGKEKMHESCSVNNFNYIKLGPYIEGLGGLDSSTTNQHFYRIENGKLIDETRCFQKKKVSIPYIS